MGVTITCLVVHILCTILWAIDAIIADKKSFKIMYTICSILWGLCVVLDIIKLVGMA